MPRWPRPSRLARSRTRYSVTRRSPSARPLPRACRLASASFSGQAALSDGTNVTLTPTNTVTVRASQAGDAIYDATPSVDQSFTVRSAGGAAPTIGAIPDQTVLIDDPTDFYHLTVSDAETPDP